MQYILQYRRQFRVLDVKFSTNCTTRAIYLFDVKFICMLTSFSLETPKRVIGK